MPYQQPLILTIFLGLLCACGTSPPVRYYALDAMPASFETQAAPTIVGIGPLRFPDYLQRPQIVTRTSTSELKVAEFDRWAEPLDAAFQRTLAANLGALLPQALVIEFPFGGGRFEPDLRIIAQVARFDVGADRVAVLDVSWGVTDGTGENVAAPRRSLYRADVAGSDYDSIVGALRRALEGFSRDLASVLRESGIEPP